MVDQHLKARCFRNAVKVIDVFELFFLQCQYLLLIHKDMFLIDYLLAQNFFCQKSVEWKAFKS